MNAQNYRYGDRLPIEYPLKDAARFYLRRMALFSIVTLLSLLALVAVLTLVAGISNVLNGLLASAQLSMFVVGMYGTSGILLFLAWQSLSFERHIRWTTLWVVMAGVIVAATVTVYTTSVSIPRLASFIQEFSSDPPVVQNTPVSPDNSDSVPPPGEPLNIPEPITVVLFGTGLAALSAAAASRHTRHKP